ncbi:phosphate/sulfate permease [Caldalkalibacillus uzonensis]|uniref:Phosphate/sulfate permease n=1 Tax=Caldalkalibacillus uzonensis TaxID=353224 RepID=A0ABU0CM21_9BACI|nr:hypothetical protein [Caldalkalibacillus uzonensis]MDQ0337465.1 phosphate/sulfate permease [Caldalkalibacillus uzonensis]
MKKYAAFLLLHLMILSLITFLLSRQIGLPWSHTMFFVGGVAIGVAAFYAVSGDFFSKRAELETQHETRGVYEERLQKYTITVSPFFVASILFFICSFIFPYLF